VTLLYGLVAFGQIKLRKVDGHPGARRSRRRRAASGCLSSYHGRSVINPCTTVRCSNAQYHQHPQNRTRMRGGWPRQRGGVAMNSRRIVLGQRIHRFVRMGSVLAISLLSSCISTYMPDQSASQKMSVKEARDIVLALAQPPAVFFSADTGDWTSIPKEDVYKVYVRTTSIIIVGHKKYTIPFRDLSPTAFRNDVTTGFTMVYLQNTRAERRGFAADRKSSAPLYRDKQAAQHLADALNVLKSAALRFPGGEEALFQDTVRNYRASTPKPQLSEAARRLRVQAEGAVNDKEFDTASDLYEQALGVAPWWPEGHFNRALTLAETGDFATAILEMKRYLALVPDAPDARAAQDKIYDWERKADTPH
jgi:hypothetical protein